MKNDEFHIPFLHGMIAVALVTVVSMAFAHYFIKNSYSSLQKSASFTSQESHYSSQSPQ